MPRWASRVRSAPAYVPRALRLFAVLWCGVLGYARWLAECLSSSVCALIQPTSSMGSARTSLTGPAQQRSRVAGPSGRGPAGKGQLKRKHREWDRNPGHARGGRLPERESPRAMQECQLGTYLGDGSRIFCHTLPHPGSRKGRSEPSSQNPGPGTARRYRTSNALRPALQIERSCRVMCAGPALRSHHRDRMVDGSGKTLAAIGAVAWPSNTAPGFLLAPSVAHQQPARRACRTRDRFGSAAPVPYF